MLAQESILLLSDDASAQDGIVKCLQTGPQRCRVQVVNLDDAALRLIGNQNFDAVFCHRQSGASDSVNFLSEVWKRKPKSARFVVATEIDAETQMRCAFGGHQFLELPLKADAVQSAFQRSHATKVILENERVQLMLSRIRLFPSKPTIYAEVMRELGSEDPSTKVIGDLISKDLGIATKLIQLVNSPFYGQAQPIEDLTQAVLLLGLEITSSVVLSLEAISRFERVKQSHFSSEQIWNHCLKIANLSRKIAQTCEQDSTVYGNAYLSGLLHDIGKLALAQNFNEEYHNVVKTAAQEKRPLFDAEYEILGLTHADAGAYLLALWGLPMPIVEAVACHHETSALLFGEFSPAVAVHLAEQMACCDQPVEQLIEQYPPETGLKDYSKKLSAIAGR